MKAPVKISELKDFSILYQGIIIDMFIEGKTEKKKSGVVSFDYFMEVEDGLAGFGFQEMDRRKTKYIDLWGTPKPKNSVAIYWEVMRDGKRIAAVKEYFQFPLNGVHNFWTKSL